MLSLHEPTSAELTARASRLADAPLVAPEGLLAAADRGEVPRCWFHDSTTVVLGRGDEAWTAARAAIEQWAFFRQDWIRVHRPPAIEVGALAAMVVRVGPVWFANWCRIVERIDDADRFGFVYATLGDHAENGVERFLVSRSADGTVRWELTAISRPGTWYTCVGQPVVRALQARFRRGAVIAMRAAVDQAGSRPHIRMRQKG